MSPRQRVLVRWRASSPSAHRPPHPERSTPVLGHRSRRGVGRARPRPRHRRRRVQLGHLEDGRSCRVRRGAPRAAARRPVRVQRRRRIRRSHPPGRTDPARESLARLADRADRRPRLRHASGACERRPPAAAHGRHQPPGRRRADARGDGRHGPAHHRGRAEGLAVHPGLRPPPSAASPTNSRWRSCRRRMPRPVPTTSRSRAGSSSSLNSTEPRRDRRKPDRAHRASTRAQRDLVQRPARTAQLFGVSPRGPAC